jgi:hypothetical protein
VIVVKLELLKDKHTRRKLNNISTSNQTMPQTTGLDRPTKSRNNPNGNLINCSTMLDAKDWKDFDEMCESKCVTKAAVVRAFIRQFVYTGEIPGSNN